MGVRKVVTSGEALIIVCCAGALKECGLVSSATGKGIKNVGGRSCGQI